MFDKKKIASIMILGLAFSGLSVGAANAASSVQAQNVSVKSFQINTAKKTTKFKSCAQVNKKHKGGIAKSAKSKNIVKSKGKTQVRKFKVKPKVSAALYKANIKLDRDRDGVICEK